MSSPTTMIGPYVLDGERRAGGMGEVLFARHALSSIAVAIKVLPASLAARPDAQAAFLGEVRHTARLCHPNVVALDDLGTVETGPAAGSPWLAMERADGALDRVAAPTDWPTLQARLAAILAGLAHAHARGVVHLDLKPSNILVFGPDESAPRLALADFGIARLFGEPREGQRDGPGTPAYMAPEQFLPRLGPLGPPTDLYAVGVLTHVLVGGRVPFVGHSREALALQHLGATPPPLAPRFDVPSGLDGWVRALLVKSPADRPAFAADALQALLEMGSPPHATGGPGTGGWELGGRPATAGQPPTHGGQAPGVQPDGPRAITLAEVTQAATEEQTVSWLPPACEPAVSPLPPARAFPEAADPGPSRIAPAPCPATWRDPDLRGWRPWSPGPGLYPVRRLPLVGREAERDALWAALQAVARTRRPRVCVVWGALGVGKTALLDWLAERAHETGAAVVAAGHGGQAGADLFGAMVSALLGAQAGEAPATLGARARDLLAATGPVTPADLGAWVELARPGELGTRSSTLLPTLEARWAALRRLFGRVAGERVAVVTFDDAQDAPAAQAFAESLSRHAASEVPVLCVLALRDDAPASALLADLVGRPEVDIVPLGPLAPGETTHLMRTLLGLEPRVAARLEAVCAGSPLHAVGLVAAWVADGRLRCGHHGAALVGETTAELPADLARLGEALAKRALEGAAAPDVLALYLAACLGTEWALGPWQAVCQAWEARADWPRRLTRLLDRLVTEGLVRAGGRRRPTPAGVNAAEGPAFGRALGLPPDSTDHAPGSGPPAHVASDQHLRFEMAPVASALARRAAGAGLMEGLHALIAEVLGPRLPPAALGRHLRLAGRPQAALVPLLSGIRAALELADTRTAAALAEELTAALAAADLSPDAPVRFEASLLEARLARMRGAMGAARDSVARVLAAHPPDALAAEAWLERGRLDWNTGDALAARDALGHAWALATSTASDRLAADARRLHGLVDLHGGALRAAECHFEVAGRAYAELGERAWEATCLMNRGVAARQGGELDRARGLVLAAHTLHTAAGARWGVAECENELGELDRLAGDWAGAERHYGEALALNDALGSGDAVFNELNLALVHLETGQLAAARKGLVRGRAVLLAQGRAALAAAVRVFELICETLAEDTALALLLPRAAAAALALADSGFVDADLSRWTARAALHASARGEAALAGVFESIQCAQRRALSGGDP